jgi:hypothetical protein
VDEFLEKDSAVLNEQRPRRQNAGPGGATTTVSGNERGQCQREKFERTSLRQRPRRCPSSMIRFLFDECLSEHYDTAVRAWNERGEQPFVDFARVGRLDQLPKKTPDPTILKWAEAEGRIIIAVDYTTMPGHLADHLASGCNSPGICTIRPGVSPAAVAFELALITHAGKSSDFVDCITYIPL